MSAVPFIFILAVVTLIFFVVANLRMTKNPLSAQVLLRFYLYIASFVTLVVLVTGLSFLLAGLFSLASPEFSYARPLTPTVGGGAVQAPNAPRFDLQAFERQADERQRDQQSTDLIRGGTLTVMGGLLFALHAWLRRARASGDEVQGNLERGFLVVGLVTFGLVGLVALPVGVYQTLKFFLVPPLSTQPRVAPGGTLASGIILTPLWLYYLLALWRAREPEAEATEPA